MTNIFGVFPWSGDFRAFMLTLVPAAGLLWLPCGAPAAPGDLDPSFGAGGKVVTAISGAEFDLAGMVVQPDGRIVVAGHSAPDSPTLNYLHVIRYLPDGSLDPSFNGNGKVATEFGPYPDYARCLALQADGKILVGGETGTGSFVTKMLVVRYLPDGSLDTSFNGTGWVGAGGTPSATAEAIAVQDDGKILLAGYAYSTSTTCVLLRLLPDGALDFSFNGTGTVLSTFGDAARSGIDSMVVQKDGKIAVAGVGAKDLEDPFSRDSAFSLARFLPDGSPDTTFNGTGTLLIPPGPGPSDARTLAVQPDGKIVAGGSSNYHWGLVRVNPGGEPDPSFNGTGRTVLFPPYFSQIEREGIESLTVDRSGRIFGTTGAWAGDIPQVGMTAVLCLQPDGTPDPRWGGDGIVTTTFGQRYCHGYAIAVDRNSILVAGLTYDHPDQPSVALARWQTGFASPQVEQPALHILTDNATAPVDFGVVTASSRTLEFTVRNPGTAPLSGLTVSITNESHPGEFTYTQPAAASLSPGGGTTFLMTFLPSAAPGGRTARLRVSGNDGAVRAFTIGIKGVRATASEVWRYAWFGSVENAGSGADLSDFDRDGVVNLMEYATGGNPHQFTPPIGTLVKSGAALEFTYTRPAAALTELKYEPEAAVDVSGAWSATGITSVVVSESEGLQTVRAMVNDAAAKFVRLRVSRL